VGRQKEQIGRECWMSWNYGYKTLKQDITVCKNHVRA
jgi:hypothetical protein